MRALRAILSSATALAVAVPISVTETLGDAHTTDYVGSRVCLSCHEGLDRPITDAYPQTPHARAFWRAGEESQGRQILGDFTQAPGFTRDQVAYVLGAGQREQAYLDAGLKLLVPLWDVASQTWQVRAPPADGATQCLGCHTTGYDESSRSWKEPGVGCESCHGPGSEHTASKEKKRNIVRPQRLRLLREAMICGRCHSLGQDTTGEYAHSIQYRPGDNLSKSFVDARPREHVPHAAPPWAQYSEWRQSKHATGSPPVTCTGCHDPHGVTGLPYMLRKEGNELCLDCHDSLEGPDHSAESLRASTCNDCHMPQGSHFFPLRPPEPAEGGASSGGVPAEGSRS